jgi:glycosyltransferase involved in cell wall biosynthesis
MHIAIDARIINSSTGRYVERLLTNLEQIDSTNTYTVMVRQKDADYWKPTGSNFKVVIADFPNYSFPEQIGFTFFLNRLKPDLVHFCMPQQPLLYRGKRVTTVHDLTLVRFENIDMNPIIYKIRKQIFTQLLKNVVKRSKAVFTPTEYVRQDVLNFTSPAYSSKVMKTLEAWDAVAADLEVIPELDKKDFVFFVGNAFPYKNIDTILDAFTNVQKKHPNLHLGLAGKKDIFYEQIEQRAKELGISDHVHILGFISEGQKRWMFRNGKAYIIASFSEGFHIPGLEAMAEDCPVISSDATCLPEVYEKAAYYFDPHKTDELEHAIERLLTDEKLRATLIKAGKKQLGTFSWRRMAEQTHAVYMDILQTKD